jgi:protein involved in polysaccharide export with SLBB domain
VGKEKVEAAIDKMIAAYDLNPHSGPPIPDDPPPHEGAMISLPYIIEPSDLILVEVLETLPGRPISGERLVRPDGTMCLGFYGDVYVKGLSLAQAKVAIIKHLRAFLEDEFLGLQTPNPPFPDRPDLRQSPSETGAKVKPRPSSHRKPSRSASARPRVASRPVASGSVPVVRIAAQTKHETDQEKSVPPGAPHQVVVPRGDQGQVTITIHVDGGKPPAVTAPAPQGEPAVPLPDEPWFIVPPEKSATVFVDITGYNTKTYYIGGDVQVIGKLPCSGHETVLDAIQYAGGLLSSADPGNIRLVRPARGGKPAKVYKVDLPAIEERGDATSNYQLFPGDRLIVGRNATVRKTAELDRLAAPIQTITASILQEAFTLRALQLASSDKPDQLLKELVDFWAKRAAPGEHSSFDEKTLREILLRRLTPLPPAGATPAPK